MGTTRYYCRYIKVLLTLYSGAITIRGIDLRRTIMNDPLNLINPPRHKLAEASGSRDENAKAA